LELGVTLASARALAAAIEPVYPGRLVRVGQNYTVTLDKEQDFYGNEVIAPVRVSFTPPGGEEVIVESDDDGRYMAMIDGKQAKPASQVADAPHFRTRAKITSSLYATAKDNGVPTHIINAAMKVLGYEIDLQRQIQAGDTLELFYGIPLTGSSTKRKVLHYAKLRSSGRDHIYYRYTDSEGKTAFYDENGISANKSLMRTPISGVRITSGFGMRRHPLLGYNKLHTGIDFGAPRGTPIKAAGDGVVEHAGWRGAYGRTVIIKHDGKYSTLYAHMSRTASLKPGQKVRQGQVIGYVGSTGRSTGPHLHYEVRKGGKPVNPKRVQIATTTRLTGKELANFNRHKNRIMAMMETAPSSVQIAQVSANPN
jgi:murein DD-endopeptidase MepM/ murein hydrolase activator NlpD